MIEYIKKEILPMVIIAVVVGGLNLAAILRAYRGPAPKYREIILTDKTIKLEFDRISNESDDILIYKDKDNSRYLIKDNKLIGYIKNIDNFGLKKKKNLNYKIGEVEELFNVTLKDYKLNKINNEYFYQKYINDIKTSDGIYIEVNDEGIIIESKINKIGIFDDLVTDITIDKINCVKNEINKNINQKYEIKDVLIDYNDSNYVLYCLVDGENINSAEIVYNL